MCKLKGSERKLKLISGLPSIIRKQTFSGLPSIICMQTLKVLGHSLVGGGGGAYDGCNSFRVNDTSNVKNQ